MDTIMEMKEAGYEPTERTYNHVLRACRETEVRRKFFPPKCDTSTCLYRRPPPKKKKKVFVSSDFEYR